LAEEVSGLLEPPQLFRSGFRAYYRASARAGLAGLVAYVFFPPPYPYVVTVLAAVLFFYLVHLREIRLDAEGILFRTAPRFDEHHIRWRELDHSIVFVGQTGIFREIALFTNEEAFPPNGVFRISLGFLEEKRLRDLLSTSDLKITEAVDERTYIRRLRGE